MKRCLGRFRRDASGAALIEFSFVVALMAIVVLGGARVLGASLAAVTSAISASVN